jgi:hypothetical protein
VLAGAVRLGVAGDRLWLVTGGFGAGLACLLALAAAAAVWRLSGAESGRAAAGALAAGLLAGGGWALAPAAVAVGRTALGDEPAALAAWSFLLATGLAATARGAKPVSASLPGEPSLPGPSSPAGGAPATDLPASGWRAPAAPVALAAVGGVSFGLLAGMRPASALLLAPAALILAGHGWRAHGGRELRRRALAWACGAAVAPLLVVCLLWRSQLPPWQWSGYGFWVPRWYADAGTTFSLRHALHGNEAFARGSSGRPIPNLRFYAQILAGWPGLSPDSYLGIGWPALGWLAGLWLAWRERRRPAVAAGALAAAALAAGHLAFFSLYFFPAARFLLAPLALPLLAAAVACGLGIAGPSAPAPPASTAGPPLLAPAAHTAGGAAPLSPAARRADGASPPLPASSRPLGALAMGAGTGLAAAGLAAALLAGFLAFRAAPVTTFPDHDVRAAFAAWHRQPNAARAASTMPFDPLEAQAMGLLPPEVVSQIQSWGHLPPTVHVQRLRALGILPTSQ